MLHDLTIKTIAEYYIGDSRLLTKLLTKLCRLSQRFYRIRHYFIKLIRLSPPGSFNAYLKKPYAWNHVNRMYLANLRDHELDLGLLSNVEMIIINNCWNIIIPTSPLKSKEVQLKYCNTMIDISCFKNVRWIDISECPALTDISPLANSYSVTINACIAITNFHTLKNVKYLKLYHCHGLRDGDVSGFANIYSLLLCECTRVSDLSPLSHLHELTIIRCDLITNFYPLGNIYKLSIIANSNLIDVSPLRNVKDLYLGYCDGIRDLSPLMTVKKLRVSPNEYIDKNSLKDSIKDHPNLIFDRI